MKLLLLFALMALVLSACNLKGTRTDNNSRSVSSGGATNSAGSGTNTESNQSNSNSGASEDAALQQLVAIEQQWKQAKASGDSSTLEKIFADEFTNTDPNGKSYNKAQWIKVFKGGVPNLKSWNISEPKLVSFAGNTATLTLLITYSLKRGPDERSRDTDTFVRRDERWQVVSSQSIAQN